MRAPVDISEDTSSSPYLFGGLPSSSGPPGGGLETGEVSSTQRTSSVALRIGVFAEILSIKSIALRKFKLTVELSVVFRWYDGRLKYRNLRNNSYANQVNSIDSAVIGGGGGGGGGGGEVVWIPEANFIGSENTTCDVTERQVTLRVDRESDPLPDDIENTAEGGGEGLGWGGLG